MLKRSSIVAGVLVVALCVFVGLDQTRAQRPFLSDIPTAPAAGTQGRITGTTSQQATVLPVGRMATIIVSDAVGVRFRFDSSAATALSTDMMIAAGGRFDWLVTEQTKHVAGISGDGATTFEAWVFTSSP